MESKDNENMRVLEIQHKNNPYYGHRRLAFVLGWSKKKTRRIMKKYRIAAPHVVWRSDFTHIIYRGIHLYLATIIDDYSKEAVGYALGYRHTKELILTALNNACKNNNNIFPHYFYSDQGSEYKSYVVLDFLYQKNIIISMSNKGSPWQNGGQESFYGRFKTELGDLRRFECIEELILQVHRQIYYYNHQRIHTTIMNTPNKFRISWELNNYHYTHNVLTKKQVF